MIKSILPYRQLHKARVHGKSIGRAEGTKEKTDEDLEYDRMRWAWIGLSVLGVFGWAWAVGLRIRFRPVRDAEDQEEDGFEESNEEDIDVDEEDVVEEDE